jgi:hypothetical protein
LGPTSLLAIARRTASIEREIPPRPAAPPEKSGKPFCLPTCEISANRAGYAEQGLTRDATQGTRRAPSNSITSESRFVVGLKTGRSSLPSWVSTNEKPHLVVPTPEKRASRQCLISRRQADFAGVIPPWKPDSFRLGDITGQSLPVLMASRMMDVLWSDLHITHQSRSSKSGDSFYRPFRTA